MTETREVITIEGKRVDWVKIKSEYISGIISQRALAAKYGINPTLVMTRAKKEKWTAERDAFRRKAIAKVEQKSINIIGENAITARRIQQKLLLRLEREIDALPESIGTDLHQNVSNFEYEEGKKGKPGALKKKTDGTKSFRLRDLTAAWKDLSDGLFGNDDAADDPLDKLLERLDNESRHTQQ